MSRKHNTKHDGRGRSRYPRRPGIYSHGHLAEIEGPTGLRVRQNRREAETGIPWATAPEDEPGEDEAA